jgi:UDP-GlcNAc:undecaprenyl-phosphate GlcNAc-1-phosphate transferase
MAASVVLHHAGLALVSAALAGALLGFLRYNFRSASIFLGDCGSLTLGFLLGCCAIVWSNESASFGGAVAPLLAVSVPLADTALAVIRRVLRRRPVFSADREHIHHRLLARGFPARRVVLVLWGAGALAAVFALAECVTPYPASAILLALYCAGAAISVRHLGYDELRAAGRVVEPGRLLRAAHAELQLRALETALAAAQSVDQRWEAIRRACRELGFVRASMRAGGEVREAWLQDAGPCAVSWTLRVPLAAGEWINVGDGVDLAVEPSAVAPLADLLYRAIAPRLAAAPGAPVIAAAAVVAGTR